MQGCWPWLGLEHCSVTPRCCSWQVKSAFHYLKSDDWKITKRSHLLFSWCICFWVVDRVPFEGAIMLLSRYSIDVYTVDSSLLFGSMDMRFGYTRWNLMKSGSVFKSNASQAIRLPKAVALPESVKRVDIIPVGRGRLILPAGEGWDSWFDQDRVSEDCLLNRDQPEDQEREDFWWSSLC